MEDPFNQVLFTVSPSTPLYIVGYIQAGGGGGFFILPFCIASLKFQPILPSCMASLYCQPNLPPRFASLGQFLLPSILPAYIANLPHIAIIYFQPIFASLPNKASPPYMSRPGGQPDSADVGWLVGNMAK